MQTAEAAEAALHGSAAASASANAVFSGPLAAATRDAQRETRGQPATAENSAARLSGSWPLGSAAAAAGDNARPENRPVFNAVLRSMREVAERTETLSDRTTDRSPDAPGRSAAAETAAAFTLDPSLQRPELRAEATDFLSRPPAASSEASLLARPGQPDFAPELGAQLTLWVREGVHEARLQLHPAALGPVEVTIALDGAAAQVSFSAQNAETRQALEAAMPTLASSLRDAGMTLSGGGVFDQSQRQRDDSSSTREFGRQRDQADPANPAVGRDTTRSNPLAPLPTRARGVVDLVA